MESDQKAFYEPPRVEVVKVKSEGVICASGGLTNYEREDYELW